MDQRVRTETGPPPGVPERRSRRGTAAVAPDRIPFQQPELPAVEAIMAHFRRSVDAACFANGGPCARALTARIEERLEHKAHRVFVSSATTGVMAWAGFEALFVDSAPDGTLRRAWPDVAARFKTPLLIDSAPGFGALDEDGRPLGAQGDT